MRLIKSFAFALTTAVVTLSLVATVAVAKEPTALCKSNEGGALTCKAGNLTTEIHALAISPLLHTNVTDVLCESSLAKAEVLSPAKPQVVHLKELIWTNCHRHSGSGCTVKTLLLGLLNVLKTAANLAEVTSEGTVVRVQCGFFIDCAYGGKPVLHGQGANLPTHAGQLKASVAIEEEPNHSSGICPEMSTWLATYEALEDVYVKNS